MDLSFVIFVLYYTISSMWTVLFSNLTIRQWRTEKRPISRNLAYICSVSFQLPPARQGNPGNNATAATAPARTAPSYTFICAFISSIYQYVSYLCIIFICRTHFPGELLLSGRIWTYPWFRNWHDNSCVNVRIHADIGCSSTLSCTCILWIDHA